MSTLGSLCQNDKWVITSEDRAKHDMQFLMQNPVGGFISGEQAKRFFLQSGLPTSVLGHIWKLADLTADGRMDQKEFSVAMFLIKKSLFGFQLPPTLPPSLLVDPPPLTAAGLLMNPMISPMSSTSGYLAPSIHMVGSSSPMGTGLMRFGMVNPVPVLRPAVVPNLTASSALSNSFTSGVTMSTITRDWAISASQKANYSQLFNSNDRLHKGFLTGLEAKTILSQSGLPKLTLAQIWSLADIDKDGNLSLEEFSVAMYLTDIAKSGQSLPLVLPRELLPSSSQRIRHTSGPSASSGSQSLSASVQFCDPSTMTKSGLNSLSKLDLTSVQGLDSNKSQTLGSAFHISFEDRRKENFERGQAELERRREVLRDMQKKEMEDRLAFEKSEQEKREKHRLEQELRKQREFEKQIEKQRMLEAEKEEQRRKVLEQREAARQEMERQRQMEWQHQRRDQLMVQKTHEQGHVDKLQQEVGQLKLELSTLDNKKMELYAKIEQVKLSIADFTLSIENMREARDSTVAKNGQLTSDFEALQKNISTLVQERKVLEKQVSSQTPVQDENYRTVSDNYKRQKGVVDKLQLKLRKSDEQKAIVLKSLENHEHQMNALMTQMNAAQSENQNLESLLRNKKAEFARRKAVSIEIKTLNNGNEKTLKKESIEHLASNGADSFSVKSVIPSSASFNGYLMEPKKNQNSESFSGAENGLQTSNFFPKPTSEHPAKNNGVQPYHTYTAIYQFDARNPDELTLMVGDIVLVHADQPGVPSGWLSGKLGDHEGLFPESYVSLVNDRSSAKVIPKDSITSETLSKKNESLIVDQELSCAPSPIHDMVQDLSNELYVQAVYPWRAKKEYHLTFNKGDVIKVKVQQDNWWSGEFNGMIGWFPKSYVKIIEEKELTPIEDKTDQDLDHVIFSEVSSDKNIPLASNNHTSSDSLVQPCHVDPNVGDWYIAKYAYSSTEPGDLRFNVGDVINVIGAEGQWWKGILNGQTGDFPANYVAKYDASSNTVVSSIINNAETGLPSAPSPSNFQMSQNIQKGKKPEIASVIASYEASGPEQLSLQVGQLIDVHQKSASGWWEGELQARGQRKRIGWFPADYVKLLGQSSARSTPDATTPVTPGQTVKDVKCSTPVVASSAVEQVVALYNYQAQHEDELSFYKGSVISIINKDGCDWWQGELNGRTGLLPSNYVRPLSDSLDEGTALQPTESQPKTDGVYDMNSEVEKKRQDHIHELITTEETYMKDLTTALEVFYKPLNVNKILTEEELNTIFINWKEVKMCNMKLLKAMRVRRKMCGEGQPIHMIGDILCENLVHMSPYIRFCSCQLNSAALLQKKYETDSKFKELHKKCCMDSRTLGLPLSSFLLKPMQRITKYPLLIEKVFQHTPVGHPDYHNLQDALNKATELCNQVNEGVREKENSDRLEWIQTHVHCDGLAEKIIFNSLTNCLGPRKYIRSGTLYKVKSGKELVGILFNDFLLLAQPQRPIGNITSIFTMDAKTNVHLKMYRNPIFLNEVMMQKPQDGDSESPVFHVSHVAHTYSFRATSVNERDNWVRKIESTSKQYLETERKRKEKAHTSHLMSNRGVGRLLVIVIEGINLIACDANGKSDPYCEVSMGVQEHKTKVVQSTLNPKWNASMQFTIKDLKEDVLCITVYDRDLFSPNDFLGRTEVRICDILKEMRATKGPITKRLLLHEVESGEVVVKLDLQLFGTK